METENPEFFTSSVFAMSSGYDPNPAELFSFLADTGYEKDDEADQGDSTVGRSIGDTGKGAVMFCIDCSAIDQILEDDFKRTLSTVGKYMRNQIIASDGSEMTGLVLYNVRSNSNPLRQRGIHLVQDLSGLTARRIRDVYDLCDIDDSTFTAKFGGATNDADISELIFVCNAQFRRVSAAYTPRMIIFTSNDEPCGSDRKAQQAAVTRANDFLNAFPNSQIQLIPFATETFDVGKFWSSVIRMSGDELLSSEALRFLSDVESQTLKKLFKKRPVNRINLFLSPEHKLGMMMYTSFFPATKPRQMYVDPVTHKPLKSETRYVSDMTGAVLESSDILTYVEYNGLEIPLTREEVNDIRKLWPIDSGEISGNLHLVGFKPADSFLKPEYCVGHSCFLYPQETRISGSAELCSALLHCMASRGLVGIARAVPKANSSMTFVALIPQQEQLDEETGEQILSPGFHLMRLPFADDIRDLSLPDTNVAALMATFEEQERVRQDQVEKAKQIVHAMSEENWDPEMLDNPALRVCFGTLENLALGVRNEDSVVYDIVNPDSAKVAQADTYVVDWLTSLNVVSTDSLCGGGNKAPVAKRAPKPETANQHLTEREVRDLISTNRLSALTVPDLKAIIESVMPHVPAKGRKVELIEKIQLNLKQ